MSSRATRFGWTALLAAALLVRAAAVVWLAPIDPKRDGYEHAPIARHLVAGEGFTVRFLGATGSTSQQAPFYPVLLATCYRLCGVDSPMALRALELLQVLAGVALVAAVVRLVWSLARERSVGWAAGWFAALYPPHVYMVTHVQVAVWASLAGVLFLAIVAHEWRGGGSARSRWRQAIAGGVVAGLALLIEPILCLVLPVGWWVYVRREAGAHAGRSRFSPGTLLRPAAVVTVAALVIAPWMIRNRLVHGEWVFIKSTFGYAFWQGNNPASWGTDKVPNPARAVPNASATSWAAQDRRLRDQRLATRYVDDVTLTPTDYAQLAVQSEPARSRWLARRAMAWIAAHPQQYALVCARRLKYFLLFDETNPKCGHPFYRASTIVWLLLTAIGAAIGLQRRAALRASGEANNSSCESQSVPGGAPSAAPEQHRQLGPLYAIALLFVVFHSLVITSARFRLPLEALTFAWVGLVVGPLAARLAVACRRQLDRRTQRNEVQASAVDADLPVHGSHELRGPHRPSVLRRRALWETVSRRRDTR